MGSIYEEAPSDTLQQPDQPRAYSVPLEHTGKETPDNMGRPYRTPSPTHKSCFRSLAPEVAPSFAPSTLPDLPCTPRRSLRFDLTTPIAKHEHADAFGLLTPSTPDFGRSGIAGPNIQNADADAGDCEGRASDATAQDTNATSTDPEAPKSSYSKRWRTDIRLVEDDDSEDEQPLQTQFDKMQQQIRDAELAAQVADAEGSSRTRRSTRIATKELKVDTQVVDIPTKPTKAPKEVRGRPLATPSESSLKADALIVLPPDINPALLTLDWQLQYPPGGSTHPSYAYPMMDPRLFFNPSSIPIVDGLPSVLALPSLVLPMGWRQVTWSGYLPIVFDSYHQAFKLTPIGPLPLTCEEVQQGGLSKFVPGGECHPEAGLLPDANAFSDGSDEDRYNFEGVDWVLPWPQGETFDGSSGSATKHVAADAVVKAGADPTHIVGIQFYFEGRDCPDGIIDLEDAWRWIREKEVNPSAAFVPSPTKTWKGSGIHRVARKFKVPMASLMCAAIADTAEIPNDPWSSYLVKQDGRGFCPFKSVATPVDVNVALLKDIEITIAELLCYFPNIYYWRQAGNRFVRAGFGASEIANFINWSRGLEGDSTKVANSIYDQIWYENAYETTGVRKKVKIVRRQQGDEVVSYTAENWKYLDWVTTDYPLLALTHGVQHVPSGQDAGPLTAVIKWCRAQGIYDKLLSDVPALLEEAGLQPLIEAGDKEEDPDKEVLGRYSAKLRKDRKRVLKTKEKKRAAEEDEDEEEGRKEKRAKRE